MEPTTETGKSLLKVVTNLMEEYPANIGPLQRIIFLYSSKIKNEDTFITTLFGQGAVDELPLDMIKKLGVTAPLLRVQRAIENCFINNCVKELIVALEWSENQEILAQLLNWSEMEIKPPTVIKLEAQHVKRAGGKPEEVSVLDSGMTSMNIRSKSLQTADVPKTPKIRTILVAEASALCSIITCDNQIILAWADQIRAHRWPELQCIGSIHRSSSASPIICADSNGEQIVACHGASVFMWDIKCKAVVPKPMDIRRPGVSLDQARCVKCTETEVVIATLRGDLSLWKIRENTLELQQRWHASCSWAEISSVDMDENFIIFLSSLSHLVQVWNKSGAVVMKLKKRNEINCMKYFNGLLVVGGKDKVPRIWNVTTGKCITRLDALDGEIACVDINGKHIACGDKAGKLSIWSLEAVLKSGQKPIAPLYQVDTKGSTGSF